MAEIEEINIQWQVDKMSDSQKEDVSREMEPPGVSEKSMA